MDETIVNSISALGFPIVMCLCLAWFVYFIYNKNQEEIEKMNLMHREEMEKITEALNNNTIALTKLCEKMEVK